MKKSSKISIPIIIGSIIIAIGLTLAAPKSPYNNELTALQNKLAKVNNESTKIIDNSDSASSLDSSTATALKNTTISLATTQANNLMKNLYTWSSGADYTKNKATIIKSYVTSPDVISSAMPDDKDNSGNSQITALGLHSQLKSVHVYNNDINTSDIYIIATATATKNQDANDTNTPLSNNYVYKAHFDNTSQKFSSLTYIGKESLNNSTGN